PARIVPNASRTANRVSAVTPPAPVLVTSLTRPGKIADLCEVPHSRFLRSGTHFASSVGKLPVAALAIISTEQYRYGTGSSYCHHGPSWRRPPQRLRDEGIR